jgi:hypothetical protein
MVVGTAGWGIWPTSLVEIGVGMKRQLRGTMTMIWNYPMKT